MHDRGGALKLTDRLCANFLSAVATRVVGGPAVSLTDRTGAAPERLLVPELHRST